LTDESVMRSKMKHSILQRSSRFIQSLVTVFKIPRIGSMYDKVAEDSTGKTIFKTHLLQHRSYNGFKIVFPVLSLPPYHTVDPMRVFLKTVTKAIG